MSLGNDLTPVVREESILNGGEITPVTRLEWFLAKAAEGGGGGGGTVYSQVLAQTTNSVTHNWVSSFSGGPILEGASYRVIVNGTTYEPLTGTAGEEGYICLGDTYVADSDPDGDYPFGIFYKDGNLSAWLETGDSMTMQIDQIIQAVPVPTPTAADTGKVLTANNGAVEWAAVGGSSDFTTATVTINATPPTGVTISDVYISPYFEFPDENAHYAIEMMTYTEPVNIVLYKGEGYLNDVTAEDTSFNPYTLDNPTLSGGITREVENNRYVVTGDCSISGTLSPALF